MAYGVVMGKVRYFETLEEMKEFLRSIMGKLGDGHAGRGEVDDATKCWSVVDDPSTGADMVDSTGHALYVIPVINDEGTANLPYAFLALGPRVLDGIPMIQG
jgi:hypothetical protein